MTIVTSRIRSGSAALLGAFAILLASQTVVVAQTGTGPPGIDHYLVWNTNVLAGSYSVLLSDQFYPQPWQAFAGQLDQFANPVSKNNEGIVDTTLHYTWWRITENPFPHPNSVLVSNQFGDQMLNVFDAEYLLNPAWKNLPPNPPFPPPPAANHYRCYRVTGPFVPRTVTLQDQWGSYQGTVVRADWFCPPVEKTYQGHTEPIVRPDAHLVCYLVDIPPPPPVPFNFLDEFQFGQTQAFGPHWLCVPTLKQEIVGSEASTWGTIKATYR